MMELLGRELELPPGSFFQVNTAMAERLFRYAAKYIPTEGTAVELYAGIGAITLSMDTTASLYGVEIHPGVVIATSRNAERLGKTPVFSSGKAKTSFATCPPRIPSSSIPRESDSMRNSQARSSVARFYESSTSPATPRASPDSTRTKSRTSPPTISFPGRDMWRRLCFYPN